MGHHFQDGRTNQSRSSPDIIRFQVSRENRRSNSSVYLCLLALELPDDEAEIGEGDNTTFIVRI